MNYNWFLAQSASIGYLKALEKQNLDENLKITKEIVPL